LHHHAKAIACSVCLSALLACGPSRAADDTDALDLQSAPTESATTPSGARFALEAAFGTAKLRYPAPDTASVRRLSADMVYSAKLSKALRFVFSDRIDNLHQADDGRTVNSLRELYVGWQDEGAQWVVELGRINLRQGPALGFNPTDFFRDDALRVTTTVNPTLIRDYRLGSAMVRAQRLWTDGSVSLALSPKIDDRSSDSSWSADWGATNNRSRVLLSVGSQWSAQASTQVHAYADDDGDGQLGASLSLLQGEATVWFAEAAWGRDRRSAARTLGLADRHRAARVAAGLTYTTASKLSLTGEFEFNGFALERSRWDALAATAPQALGAYLALSDRRQDPAARQSVLLQARQADAFVRNLDLTGLLRTNLKDHSTLAWAEARYHFKSFDISLQWVRYGGSSRSEYGLNPQRNALQLVGTLYL